MRWTDDAERINFIAKTKWQDNGGVVWLGSEMADWLWRKGLINGPSDLFVPIGRTVFGWRRIA